MALHVVNDLLDTTLPEIDNRFQREAKQWPLVKRNYAIVGRNRAMKQISEMLDIPYTEMPLENTEAA